MKHLDLFSGIGGFSLAAQWVWGDDHKVHAFVEMDKFCQKVLNKHWPEVPIIEDVKGYQHDGTTIDLLTGGFPCQPFSCAGKRAGKKDDRYLWPEMLRIISEVRPAWLIGENVAGIINMGLDQVLFDLENEGYACQPFIIPACAVNAPHRRDRVWIVGHTESSTERKVRGICEGESTNPGRSNKTIEPSSNATSREPRQQAKREGRENIGGRDREINTDTSSTRLQGSEPGQPIRLLRQSYRSGCDQGSDWSENWLEVATSLCRVDDGVPKTLDIGRLICYIEKTNNITEVTNGQKNKINVEKKASENDTTYKLRILRKYIESAKASRRLDESRLGTNTLSEMPCEYGLYDGEMGIREEEKAEMCDMQENVSPIGQPQAQNVWCKLPVCIRKAERNAAVGQRVNRLKSLGNAIVPQVAAQIMLAIKEVSND